MSSVQFYLPCFSVASAKSDIGAESGKRVPELPIALSQPYGDGLPAGCTSCSCGACPLNDRFRRWEAISPMLYPYRCLRSHYLFSLPQNPLFNLVPPPWPWCCVPHAVNRSGLREL